MSKSPKWLRNNPEAQGVIEAFRIASPERRAANRHEAAEAAVKESKKK